MPYPLLVGNLLLTRRDVARGSVFRDVVVCRVRDITQTIASMEVNQPYRSRVRGFLTESIDKTMFPSRKFRRGIANDHADLSAATIECPSGIILVGKTDEVLSVLRGGVTGHARITSINADAPPATLNVARSPGSSATVSWDSSATGSRSASRMEIAFCAGDVLKCTNTSH